MENPPEEARYDFEDLKNPALQERLKDCKTVDELLALAGTEGMELSDEQLGTLSGGIDWEEYGFCGKDAGGPTTCTVFMPIGPV